MAPRSYDRRRKAAASAETRRRIVQATVNLHADKGILATTYAMIAEQADVSVPTVYNHFPTRSDLLGACIGHVGRQAPPLGPEIYDRRKDVPSRVRALVGALFRHYAFRAPWLRWAVAEAEAVPELRAQRDKTGTLRLNLIEQALRPGFQGKPPLPLLRLANVLLDFPAWRSLTADGGLSPDEAAAVLTEAVITLYRGYRKRRGSKMVSKGEGTRQENKEERS